MNKSRARLIKGFMISAISVIVILLIILLSLWSIYIENQKKEKSEAVLSIIKLSIVNSSEGDMDKIFSSIAEYIGEIPNRKIAIYDDEYKLRVVYPVQKDEFDITKHPDLFNLLQSSDAGRETIHIDNADEEIFWDWVISSDGSRQLLIIYGMRFDAINEFSFVFIISYLLIIFILILVVLIHLNDKYDYFISISKLYELSMRCDD